LAKPERVTGMADSLRNPSYSTSVGLLRLGLEMDTAIDTVESRSKFGQFFGGVLRRLLPDDNQ
jgi:hypothetical protein